MTFEIFDGLIWVFFLTLSIVLAAAVLYELCRSAVRRVIFWRRKRRILKEVAY